MDAFASTPPDWTQSAIHARGFHCPTCQSSSLEASQVWLNYRSPVWNEERRRKWQEFYHCNCGSVWWAWNSDRPPTPLKKPDTIPDRPQNPWLGSNPFE